MPIWWKLFMHFVRDADSRTFCTAGTSRPMRMAMIAITTSNSMRVNAWRFRIRLPGRTVRGRKDYDIVIFGLVVSITFSVYHECGVQRAAASAFRTSYDDENPGHRRREKDQFVSASRPRRKRLRRGGRRRW